MKVQEKRKNMTKIKLISISTAFLVVIVFIIGQCSKQHELQNDRNAELVEYRFDREPLIKNFPDMPMFQDCYWKTNTIGRTDFGPTNFWLMGFIVCANQDIKNDLLKQYAWEACNINFPPGINPEITGFQKFNWYSNKDFAMDIIPPSYLGNVYFDSINGVVYVDVENN